MKITWLGDHTDPDGGPRFNTWNGIRFPVGEAIEVTDPGMIAKAKVHPQYRIEKERTHVEIQQGKEEQKVQVKAEEEDYKDYDYRKAEKGSGYSPVKKKVRKKKPTAGPPAPTANTTDP